MDCGSQSRRSSQSVVRNSSQIQPKGLRSGKGALDSLSSPAPLLAPLGPFSPIQVSSSFPCSRSTQTYWSKKQGDRMEQVEKKQWYLFYVMTFRFVQCLLFSAKLILCHRCPSRIVTTFQIEGNEFSPLTYSVLHEKNIAYPCQNVFNRHQHILYPKLWKQRRYVFLRFYTQQGYWRDDCLSHPSFVPIKILKQRGIKKPMKLLQWSTMKLLLQYFINSTHVSKIHVI